MICGRRRTSDAGQDDEEHLCKWMRAFPLITILVFLNDSEITAYVEPIGQLLANMAGGYPSKPIAFGTTSSTSVPR